MFYNIIMMSLEKLNEQQRQSISLVTLFFFFNYVSVRIIRNNLYLLALFRAVY